MTKLTSWSVICLWALIALGIPLNFWIYLSCADCTETRLFLNNWPLIVGYFLAIVLVVIVGKKTK